MSFLVQKIFEILPPEIYVLSRKIVEGDSRCESEIVKRELGNVKGYILDIGCGSGEVYFDTGTDRYVGVEMNFALLRMANKKHGGGFVCADALKLPFADETFAAAFFVKVAHHLDPDTLQGLLSEAKRVLVPGGRLVVIEPLPALPSTTMIHKIVVSSEIGKFHRTFEDFSRYLFDFSIVKYEYFRKKRFDFYFIVCAKKTEENDKTTP